MDGQRYGASKEASSAGPRGKELRLSYTRALSEEVLRSTPDADADAGAAHTCPTRAIAPPMPAAAADPAIEAPTELATAVPTTMLTVAAVASVAVSAACSASSMV